MNFNGNLKIYRELKGYSGKEFSQMLDVPYTTYMSYENKGGEPKFELLIKMANILDITVDELVGNDKKTIDLIEKIKSIVNETVFTLEEDKSNKYYVISCVFNVKDVKNPSPKVKIDSAEFLTAMLDIFILASKEKQEIIKDKIQRAFYNWLFGNKQE